MLGRTTLLRRTAVLAARRQQQQRPLTAASKNPYKRALNKKQLEGEGSGSTSAAPASKGPAAPPPPPSGGGSTTKPADVGKAAPSGGGGGGGGALLPLLALGGVGVGGAYYNGLIPEEYLPDVLKGSAPAAALKKKEVKVTEGLKDAVKEATKKEEAAPPAPPAAATEEKADAATPAPKEEEIVVAEEEVSLEHPENGNRVDIAKINLFYDTVNAGHAKQAEEEARAAAARATEFDEAEETRIDPMSAMNTAAAAMSELQSSGTLKNSQTLAAAKAAIRSDLDADYFADLEKLSDAELRVRIVQLATEMSDRTKWEALRLKEFLAMKEKEVGDRYLEILQKQRLEFESLLAQKLREQEDSIARQANAALAAKEESIQSLLKATSDAREAETKEILTEETKRIASELELDYQSKLQNQLAQMKQGHAAELEGHVSTMKALQSKIEMLEQRLEVSHTYEAGSKRAHRVSAAALALANKLEAGEGAAVELAALKGAAAEDTVIASAVGMIPKSFAKGVMTVAELQSAFDESYGVGRQAAMVPEGRAGLEGQLLGMLFAKLSVPPSPDAIPTSEEEGSITDGILSLARKYVQLGDLEKAVEQLDKLSGQTSYVMNDWKTKAMDRVSTERALKVIKLECALLNKDLVGSES